MPHTHYDSLKIARDAPVEVVRAAYRALSLKYHPDRHASALEATEMMSLLNSAYDVLSDPEKRRDYDAWIKFVESKPARGRDEKWIRGRADWIGAPGSVDGAGTSRLLAVLARFRHYWLLYLLALIAIFLSSLWYESLYLHRSKALTPLASAVSAARDEPPVAQEPSPFARRHSQPDVSAHAAIAEPSVPPEPQSPRAPAEAQRQPAPTPPAATHPAPPAPSHTSGKSPGSPGSPSIAHANKPAAPIAAPRVRKSVEEPAETADQARAAEPYTRPSAAPNGEPWPSSSDYVPGYPQHNINGLSQVVIDNSKSNADAFVKVVSVAEIEPKVVRNVFIQASDRFTVNNLRAGTYELRYENLDSGVLMRSEVFALEESAISSGTRYSTVTLTLRSKPDESMNTFSLTRDEF